MQRRAGAILSAVSSHPWWQWLAGGCRRFCGNRNGTSPSPWRKRLDHWLHRLADTSTGRLAVAIAAAAALHALVIFGVGFATPPRHPAMSLAVTLVHSPAAEAPPHAHHFGAHDQRAAEGGKASPPPGGRIAAAGTRAESNRGLIPVLPNHTSSTDVTSHLSRPRPAQRQAREAARKKLVAGYLAKWRARVEQVGSQHFPGHALAEAGHHQLTISVVVDAAGQVVSSRVVKSSGSPTLDQAALHILRLAAPFPPFSQALKNRHQTLRFAYTWRFTPQGTTTSAPSG